MKKRNRSRVRTVFDHETHEGNEKLGHFSLIANTVCFGVKLLIRSFSLFSYRSIFLPNPLMHSPFQALPWVSITLEEVSSVTLRR